MMIISSKRIIVPKHEYIILICCFCYRHGKLLYRSPTEIMQCLELLGGYTTPECGMILAVVPNQWAHTIVSALKVCNMHHLVVLDFPIIVCRNATRYEGNYGRLFEGYHSVVQLHRLYLIYIIPFIKM